MTAGSPSILIIEAIEHEVPTHPVTQLLTLDEKGLVIVDPLQITIL